MSKLIYEVVNSTSVWSIFGVIDEFSTYDDLIKELYTAEKGDSLIILLNSPGGRVDVGQTIINAFQETKAAIHCIVEAPCYSMAAILALCGDKLTIKGHSFLMFHNYSTIYIGKGNEIGAAHEAESKHFTQLLNIYCQPFLTQKECDNILNGLDLYLYHDDKSLTKRIKRHFK